MSQVLDFKYSAKASQLPVARMANLLVCQTIEYDADCIVFELDLEANKEIKAEREEMMKTRRVVMKKFPTAFQITLKFSEKEEKLSPADGYLFEPVMRCFT